jgi:L,D-transpeptidase ErfK/SrfK
MNSKILLMLSCTLMLAGLWPISARAWHPRLQEESFLAGTSPPPVIGRNLPYLIAPGETLVELARRSGTGYEALVRANPGVDPWIPPTGAEVFLPLAFVLPLGTDEGITINLAEMRLYLVWQEDGRQKVRAYPVGIGQEGWDTPLGRFTIATKVANPSWTPPAAIRETSPDLPAWVPPGPNNPLGDYWLGLSVKGYGIHGTSKPFGVGRRVSHGCLRLYPEDIRDLFQRVTIGTAVRIIDQPVKVGAREGELYLETHPPVTGRRINPVAEVLRQAAALSWQGRLDMEAIHRALRERRGIPTLISAP